MTTWIANPLAILDGRIQSTEAGSAPADATAWDQINGGGGIVVADGKIVEMVAPGSVPQTPYDQTFDASQHVVLPGLINTHHHYYQTLTRAFPPALGKELFPWLKVLYLVWQGLDERALSLAAELAMAEMLLSGCTMSVDHHYLFPAGLNDAIDIEVEAASRVGMRALLTRGSMSLSEKDGGLPPDGVVQDEEQILADSARLIRKYHQTGAGAMVQIALAPCSPFSVTESLMRDTAALAQQEGVRLHTHLAETEDENQFCLDRFGCRPVEYLERCGWAGPSTWVAHGIHFTLDEIARLGAAGVGVSHCPSSNMLLASGMCPTRDLERAGAPVGLGIDGSASNDGSNMVQEIRQAFLMGRLKYGSSLSHLDALRWASAGSARCIGREDLGVIAPGKAADLALFKLDELRFSGAGDPIAALVLCGAHRADAVMVNGRFRVLAGEIQGLDLEQLRANHAAAARKLQS